jgi:hypothetical protein
MMKNFPKIIALFLVTAVLANGLVLMTPKKARATGLPVIDAILNASTWTKIGQDIAKWAKDHYQAILRDQVSKRLIDYIVDQTVEWIQGGGTPKFVSDWKGFLKDEANIAFDEIVNSLGLAAICSPFKWQLQLSLYPTLPLSDRLTCTIDQVVDNIENFYEDFRNGDWIAYNAAWEPQNNYYGAMIMVQDDLLRRTAENQQAAQNEAVASGGFLSVKKCIGGGTGQKKPGFVQDTDGNWCSSDNLEIQTPGSLAGDAIANAMGADAQWAANITSWTSALVNAAINRLIKEGVNAMKPSAESSSGSYYPSEYGALSQTMMQYDKAEQTAEIKKIIEPVQCLYDIKKSTASSTGQLVGVLMQIKGLSCEATSSLDQEVVVAQKNFVRLTKEVGDLETKINEGADLMAKIASATTTEAQAILGLRYSEFMNRYSDSFVEAGVKTTTDKYSNYGGDTLTGGGFCSTQTQGNVETATQTETSQTAALSGNAIEAEINKLKQTIKDEVDPPLIFLLNRAIAFLEKLNQGNLTCGEQAGVWVGLEFLKADFTAQMLTYEATGYPHRANTLRTAMSDLCSVLSSIASVSADLMQAEKESKESASNLAGAQTRLNSCR